MFTSGDHTYAICAYKESPHLIECIESLISQSELSNVIMTTSTPNKHIEDLAKRHSISLLVNPKSGGIASDWNFAYSQSDTSLVTIAHQDDVYCENYTCDMLSGINAAKDPLIYFTNYGELRNGEEIDENQLLRIKRVLLAPLASTSRQNSIFWRRRILSFGSAICCPSVTMIKDRLPNPLFRNGLKTNLDWDAWERISLLQGAFVYNQKISMYHRIHEESATSILIEDNTRGKEDEILLSRFWPTPIAKLINIFYSKGQDSNAL